MRSRTSVQTEDDQLIAGQSARVSRNQGFGLVHRGFVHQIGRRELLMSRELKLQRFMAQKSMLSSGVIFSNSHFTQCK